MKRLFLTRGAHTCGCHSSYTRAVTLCHPQSSHIWVTLSPKFTSIAGRQLLLFYRGGDGGAELEVKLTNHLKVPGSGKEKRLSSFAVLRWVCPGVYKDGKAAGNGAAAPGPCCRR